MFGGYATSQVLSLPQNLVRFGLCFRKAPIRKATEAQRRLWLLGAEGLRGDTKSGLLKFQGNEYWADWMVEEIAGRHVVARFDPADFCAGLHIYLIENVYLGHAPCKAKVGFPDQEEARITTKTRRAWINSKKRPPQHIANPPECHPAPHPDRRPRRRTPPDTLL